MGESLIRRMKNSLNMQFYTMNDSWLQDCIEYYLNDHENPTQDEIITFVTNQWVLSDLREINNENGCLPKNLAKQKCTTLPGKYILQMNKIYDISTSKYKQLEKIRNVSSENVEATENENASQEDKFQAWEPKSKRMLQLSLTDGIQDVLAIEYKPIRFLKDNLYPGFKLMIKGPVICRKGVILLEEINLIEIGGEVDSLLIVNAVENVFARALNLEENPDPYNDNYKESPSSKNTQNTVEMEDDFDIDSQVIDQIDKQIQQQNSTVNKHLITSATRNEQRQISQTNTNDHQGQNNLINNKYEILSKSVAMQKKSVNYKNQNSVTNFKDDDDAFLEMVDEKEFENFSAPKSTSALQNKYSERSTPSMKVKKNQNDDIPTEDEMCDITKEQSPFFNSLQSQTESLKLKSNLSNSKSSTSKTAINRETLNKHRKLEPNPIINVKPSICNDDFPDDDFNMDDFDIRKDDFKEQFNKNNTINSKSSQSSTTRFDVDDFDAKISDFKNNYKQNSNKASILKSSQASSTNSLNLKITHVQNQNTNNSSNSSNETKFEGYKSLENIGSEFENEFDVEFDAKVEVDYKPPMHQQKIYDTEKPKIEKIYQTATIKSENQVDDSTIELTGVKRPASTMSPLEDAHKVRCLQNSPKVSKTSNRKITDFISNKSPLLSDQIPKVCEFLCDVLKEPLKDERTRTVVRGKVVNIIKLNLLKRESRSYFHLEGTITDGTASLDIVFSSEMLEKIIGYSPQEFSQKRKQSKINPSIKDQLREDLMKAQKILRDMDALMEIELKKNEKALIVNTANLTKEQKKCIDARVQLLKM